VSPEVLIVLVVLRAARSTVLVLVGQQDEDDQPTDAEETE
jgi:hypothetical protein